MSQRLNMRFVFRLMFSVLSAIALVILFQNCTRVVNQGSSDSKVGGEGTDGKTYRNYAQCSTGNVAVANAVWIASDLQTASVTRQDCADLPIPLPVAVKDLQFGMDNPDAFTWKGANYDKQQLVVSQQVTVQWCRSANVDTEVRIWKYLDSNSGLFGSLTLNTGDKSESLLLDPSVTGVGNYATKANQQSYFSLTNNSGTISLSYAVNGGATKSISGLICGTQASPPPPANLPTLAPPAGYTSNLLAFEDRFNSSTLDASKWIPQIADQNGIWRQSVPAPYSAPNAGGTEAEFYDPQHVITGAGLNLIATRDATFPGYSWRSGAIASHGLFYIQKGYVQVRARFPDSSSGMWAGINFAEGGAVFGIASGFLGGLNPNRNVFGNLLSAGNAQVVYDSGADLSADYHVYGVEYRPGVSIKMYIDGKLFANYATNIPTGSYELILNLAVAQNAVTWHTLPDGTTPSPSEFDISDIQVYNLPP